MSGSPSVYHPDTVEAAVQRLAAGARPLAGATWAMRAALRGEAPTHDWVSLRRLRALAAIDVGPQALVAGAAVTHRELAGATAGLPGLQALAQAARGAANPAIRAAATLGGNLCTPGFPAADLAPALIALDAAVEIAWTGTTERLPVEAFLARREALPSGWLLTRVIVPRSNRLSAHARLPLRKAGDYPVALVSLSLERGEGGVIATPRIAVGSVEPVARRWTALERALDGAPLDPSATADVARGLAHGFQGRDGVECEGWYRVEVLPSLVRSALAAILQSS